MSGKINEQLWHQLTQEVMTGMREWRLQHPKATLREMETELDARLNRMRARMLEDMALASVAADWADTPAADYSRSSGAHHQSELLLTAGREPHLWRVGDV